MKKILPAAAIAVAVSIGVAGSASAKGPTVKITIAGGRLAGVLEVADPRVVGSFSPWAPNFMDRDRERREIGAYSWPGIGVVTAPPRENQRYEVSFYVRLSDTQVSMKYVFTYCPSPSDDQGYVYLPGPAERWYTLNTSTIYRQADNGKWHYASREWDALIKPLIAAAESGQQHAL